MKSNAVEEEIETWIVGPSKNESKAADLAADDDIEDIIDIAPYDDCLYVEATDLSEASIKKAMTNARSKLKVWPVLFNCLNTGAVDIKGIPATVYSDHGIADLHKTCRFAD